MKFFGNFEKASKYSISVLYIFLSALFLFVLRAGKNSQSVKIESPKAQNFTGGWYYYDGNQKIPLTKIPCNLTADENGTARIYHDLSGIFKDDIFLDYYAHHSTVTARLDEKILYEYDSRPAPKWMKTCRNLHHFIPIPRATGGTICIESQGPGLFTSGELKNILFGTKEQITISIISNSIDKVFISFLLIFSAILFFIITRFYAKIKEDISIYRLTILFLCLGVWQLEDLHVFQIFTGSQPFHWFMKYPFQIVIVFNTFRFIRDVSKNKENLFLKIFFAASVLITILMLALQLTGTVQFTNLVFLTYPIYAAACGYLMFSFNFYNEFPSRGTKILFNTSIASAIFLFIAVFLYKGKTGIQLDYFLDAAIIVVFLALTLIVYQKAFKERETVLTSELYKKLAFIDVATGVSSRTAWYKLTEEFENEKSNLHDCCLIMFDMNNLKTINDKLGHLAGDKVISAFCACLAEIFKNCGEVFRVGGDEFIVFLNETSEEKVNAMLKKFDAAVENQTDSEIKFSAAYGYTIFTPHQQDDFITAQIAADKNMYEVKKIRKMKMTGPDFLRR